MSTSRARKNDPMHKKIQPNPKYKHVRATVDTGASLTKYMEKIEDIRKNYKYRPNENFKRMKITTLVQLIIQVHRIQAHELTADIPPTPTSRGDGRDTAIADEEIKEMHYNNKDDGTLITSPSPSLALTDGDYGHSNPPESSRSTLLSVARGIGELDLNHPPPAPENKFNAYDLSPFLILDCRGDDAYQQCHILPAFSFPKAMLSRSVNWASKELLSFRNATGKIIVVYDDDERVAPDVVCTLMDRGYENVFMLSGGLKVAATKFPEYLITGTIPNGLMENEKPKKNINKEIRPVVSRKSFTDDEIDSVEIYLDRALEDHSTGTSRLSKVSTASSRSTKMSSRASVSSKASDGRPAFRPP
ncbi:DgyrCDS6419 [Dimorphilus gyrociliatus]|uniref:DgyrCDS6419 n=1 Tax=Dimorphilus gyrociliatus TaxID=2664684 RepID=A0A7I8VPM0_9ANNE|nr:DgyrCDS6419 [Dimorphilus gyrociliatus]